MAIAQGTALGSAPKGQDVTAQGTALNSAPKGQDAIAQGTALGAIPKMISRPERAASIPAERGPPQARERFRPFRARKCFWANTQGVALGYRIMPRWGRERAAHRGGWVQPVSDRIAQSPNHVRAASSTMDLLNGPLIPDLALHEKSRHRILSSANKVYRGLPCPTWIT